MASKTRSDAPSRRDLLARSGLALGAAALAPAPLAQESKAPTDPDFADGEPHVPTAPQAGPPPAPGTVDWTWVRNQWALDWGEVDLSAMLFASNPKPVRDAIDRHRRGLDANPVRYLEQNNRPLQNAARAAAGHYFGVPAQDVALCESTTSGIGLRGGGTVRKISLFDQVETVTVEQIVGRIVANIGPRTRVLALTWVHSSTGLKMPIRAIADALIPINASRAPHEKVLFCVDGVHGFGIEDTTLPQLGCDFLVAGCHKWLFGPRGTGVIFGTPLGWSRVEPTVPSFLAEGAYSAWIGGYDPGATTAARMTPGGFKAFEHVWALIEAFGFHQQVGKTNIRNRTVELAGRLKEGMVQMPHIRLRTPRDPRLSAGLVAFDVDGLSSDGVSRRLRNYKIIGSVSPYAERHVRLTPSFRNTVEDVEYALNALHVIRAGTPARAKR